MECLVNFWMDTPPQAEGSVSGDPPDASNATHIRFFRDDLFHPAIRRTCLSSLPSASWIERLHDETKPTVESDSKSDSTSEGELPSVHMSNSFVTGILPFFL